ncbi:MAG: aminoacyl-tRNA hydrolase [Acidobacteria bacterium 13_1_20CM_3_53_8]|nr:MAG: aminoacyl-tRNA hydrolase [Acidobacteria bacterium 13_1_20CM_3_53_8]
MRQFLIVGLGNIGDEFASTRHNLGFRVVDLLAKKYDATFFESTLALYANISFGDKSLCLLKPTTFVNGSGESIKFWLNKTNLTPGELLVIVDDKDLPLGKIRLRAKGGDGRHNGLKSISMALGTDNYSRLRFGIGRNFEAGGQKDFVLGEWSKEENSILNERLSTAVAAIESYVDVGIEKTMTKYN